MIVKELKQHKIEFLLPWHAAGTLSRREADLVERALAADKELARRYNLVRQELTETIHLNETLSEPSARAMEKLFAAIDAEEAGAPRRRPRRISRTPSLTGEHRRGAQKKERGYGEARLSVADNGRGIKQHNPTGTGLKLIVALARQIGGTVDQESSNQGTRTWLTFPVGL